MAQSVVPVLPDVQGVEGTLRTFLHAQEERALVYSRFDSYFKRYLEQGSDLLYQRLVQDTTAAFSRCSSTVIHLESLLRGELDRPDLAAMLRSVQDLEREKLKHTVAIHALKRASMYRSSDRPNTDVTLEQRMEALQFQTDELTAVNSIGDLSDEDITAALMDSLRQLDGIICDINEHLVEIASVLEDTAG